MKWYSFLFLLFTNICLGQISTNGVYVNKGKTVEVDRDVYNFTPVSKPERIYFSNELVAEIYPESDFSVNNFFQDVLNTNSYPEMARFGTSTLTTTLLNGSAVFIYSGTNTNNSVVVSTPLTDVELNKGIFYFRVSDNKVIIFVLDGSLKSHGDKKTELMVMEGNALIVVPNDLGILEAKVSLGAQRLNKEIIKKLNDDTKTVWLQRHSTVFIRENGKTVGISP